MSKPDIWMPLVIGDYLADTVHLSTAEHGAYLLLLMTAWSRGGPLPDDDAQLARITRASSREWKTLRASLAPFFHVADGEWRQKRLLEELAKAQANAASQCAKSVKGAAVRWGKPPPIDAPSNATGIAQASLRQCPSPSPSPSSLRSEEKPARKKEVPIPDDFTISPRVRAWAEKKGYTDVLEQVLEVFLGRYRANGKKYIDWDETFMNAIREDWYGLRNPKAGARGGADAWWSSEAATLAKLKEMGMSMRAGESWQDLRGRMRARLDGRAA